jgi:hypothetical protein
MSLAERRRTPVFVGFTRFSSSPAIHQKTLSQVPRLIAAIEYGGLLQTS